MYVNTKMFLFETIPGFRARGFTGELGEGEPKHDIFDIL
jgi:hypothetical protein